MSEKKVIVSQDARQTKKIELPGSGITVVIYPSLLLSEVGSVNVEKLEKGNFDTIISMITKMIKSWNAYDTAESEEPLEINEENVGKALHAKDMESLTEHILEFQTAEKKS